MKMNQFTSCARRQSGGSSLLGPPAQSLLMSMRMRQDFARMIGPNAKEFKYQDAIVSGNRAFRENSFSNWAPISTAARKTILIMLVTGVRGLSIATSS